MTTPSAPASSPREPALAGQTVVVIGGSAGIGLETARRARAEGADAASLAAIPSGSGRRGWNSARGAPRPSTPAIPPPCGGH